MRKRKYLVGAAAAAVLSMAVATVAQGDYTWQSQTLEVDASAPKLDKKKPSGINSLFVDVITTYGGDGSGGGDVDRKANNTKVYFPKDFSFSTAGLSQCDPNGAGFGTSTTEAAKAACGAAQVGEGSAAIVGPIAGITAKVTAFNGTKPAGLDTILLHSRTSLGTTTVLIGTLKPSNIGGFGKMLDVPVPALPLGLAISDFKTTIPKVQLPGGKSAGAAAKKKKAKKYYIMAKCSKKTWNFQAISTYDVGGPSTATATDKCKQKKAKKKKK
jgi:hypothetical protein